MTNWRTFGIVLTVGMLLVVLGAAVSATYPAAGLLFSAAAGLCIVLAIVLFVVLLARGIPLKKE